MTENPVPQTELPKGAAAEAPAEEVPTIKAEPTIPKPHNRSSDVDRKIRGAVEKMLEDVHNPYQTVVVAALEARRINERRLKAQSILNRATEQVDDLMPEVPFVPRPAEEEEPEVKATNEAMERLACGLVSYEVDGEVKDGESFYDGELDFPLVIEDMTGKAEDREV